VAKEQLPLSYLPVSVSVSRIGDPTFLFLSFLFVICSLAGIDVVIYRSGQIVIVVH
jgi:hypothetical protein